MLRLLSWGDEGGSQWAGERGRLRGRRHVSRRSCPVGCCSTSGGAASVGACRSLHVAASASARRLGRVLRGVLEPWKPGFLRLCSRLSSPPLPRCNDSHEMRPGTASRDASIEPSTADRTHGGGGGVGGEFRLPRGLLECESLKSRARMPPSGFCWTLQQRPKCNASHPFSQSMHRIAPFARVRSSVSLPCWDMPRREGGQSISRLVSRRTGIRLGSARGPCRRGTWI